ncbi:DUF2254 family protein [Halorussus sp. MSC15.2]|uniref:DUF2254 family protein n=1 Tax=Halorussus sp. MSC15.2 TaxID=2283638 RepID=UPI0013D510A7|nr:DUF2254 family protein [Halorussus sp. MSC15.2]NEU58240.1 DUF2254 domain-containing protein [Halorussus sp. MSC15.2]
MGYLRHTFADLHWVATRRARWLLGGAGVVAAFVAATVLATHLGFYPFGAPSPNAGDVLGRLATGQAAVLGIVFSVGLVMLQLLSQRYSSALLYGLIRHPVFNLVFLLFVLSIGLDLWVLYNAPEETTLALGVAVAVAAGLAAAAIFSLLLVLTYGLKFSRPVAAVEDYLDAVFANGKPPLQPFTDSHSLDPVAEQVESELADGEVVAPKVANCYATRLFAELRRAFESDDFDASRVPATGDVSVETAEGVVEWFERPVADHLPTLAVTAYAERADDAGHTLVATLFWVSLLGSEARNSLAGAAHGALGDIVTADADFPSASGREDAVDAALLLARWKFDRGSPILAEKLAERSADWTADVSGTVPEEEYDRLADRILTHSSGLVDERAATDGRETPSDVYDQTLDQLLRGSSDLLESDAATGPESGAVPYSFADWHQHHRRLVGTLLTDNPDDGDRIFTTVRRYYEKLLYRADDDGAGFVAPESLILDLLQLTYFAADGEDDVTDGDGAVDGGRLFASVRNYGYYRLVDDICDRLTTEPEVDYDYDPLEDEAVAFLVDGPGLTEDEAFGELGYDADVVYGMRDTIERVQRRSRRRFWEVNFEQYVQYVVRPDTDIVNPDLDEIRFGSLGSGVGRLFGVLRGTDVVVQIVTAVTVDDETLREVVEKREQLESNEQLHVLVPGDDEVRSPQLDRLREESVRVHEVPPEAFPKPKRPPDWL